MANLLEGQRAIILGLANRWSIAAGIAQSFRREGAELILTYQSERQLKAVEDLAQELGAARLLQCDVTKEDEMAQLVDTLQKDGKPLGSMVHSIAFANREDLTQPFLNTSKDGFLLAHEVSVYSLVSTARALTPLMTEGGSVMTLSYLGAVRAVQNYNVMGVAKAALESTVRYLANELGERNIRVNGISAGPIKTASARAIGDFSKILDHVSSRAPLRRNTTQDEVGDTAAFLASDLSRGVTGNILYVDSGYQIVGV
ncbi:MAG: enoyl-ACP reductase [Bryobacterales bacterium]|nr:enoyl-ACP reductase [Bryobacterales bacterium]